MHTFSTILFKLKIPFTNCRKLLKSLFATYLEHGKNTTNTTNTTNATNQRICVWINTYNRPHDLALLLDDISKYKDNYNLYIYIFDDNSSSNYINTIDKISKRLNIKYFKEKINHGKEKYWILCNKAIKKIFDSNHDFDYFIKLDDDCRLVPHFFFRVINVWENITDDLKVSLNFLVDSRRKKKVWTNFKSKKIRYKKYPVYLSQWVDMNFICEKELFNSLNYEISPQPLSRWRNNSRKSSGVGEDISKRLLSIGKKMYMTAETLVIHGNHESHMNPSEREHNPLTTKKPDKTYGL